MIGRLYNDDDKNKSVEDKILFFLKRYMEDYELHKPMITFTPEVVEVNIKDYSEDIIISGIKIRPSKYVMKNCFFIGCDE